MDIVLNEDDQIAVERHLRSLNKLQAVIVVRRATDCGLKTAVDFLADFERQLNPPILMKNVENDGMGMNAKVLAIGAFREELVDHLEYPAEYYTNTRAGVFIVHSVFDCVTTSESRELAVCFGIDPWDFNQHKLDPEAVDLMRLRAMFLEDEQEEVEAFLALRDAGFEFYYMPNG